jgi:hypothetical protein
MNSQRILLQMIDLTLVVFLLAACGASTPTSTPTLVPPTPTPMAGIGEPVAGNIWQVTVKDARQETKLSESSSTINLVTGMLTASVTTYSPTSGYTFLVVKTTFRNLDPAKPKPISAEDVTVINEDGTTFMAIGGSSDDKDYCVRCPFEASIEGAELTLSFVFEVDHNTIDQDFLLQIKDVPPILFSVPNP